MSSRVPLVVCVLLVMVAEMSSVMSINVSPVEKNYVQEAIAGGAEFDQKHTVLDGVLKKYVADARVDYRGLQADPKMLDAYLSDAATVRKATFESWSTQEQLALLINVYNAVTLKLIVENYPIKSIKKIGGFFGNAWEEPVVKLFGRVITLDTLEHKILRTQYREPRIHFAIVCAAKGCPPLRAEAYVGERLDEQLRDQGMVFMGESTKNRVDVKNRTLYLSPIFKWFEEDFTENGSIQAFVKPYVGDSLGSGFTVKYTDYDWLLNEKK